jgi:hypothetical protein
MASESAEAETPRSFAAARKTLHAGDRDKGVEIGKGNGTHCSDIRTACQTEAGLSHKAGRGKRASTRRQITGETP